MILILESDWYSSISAVASVSIVAAGAFCTNRSPFSPWVKAKSTRSTASSSVIMKRVMFGSVSDSGLFALICSTKSGMTEPRLAMTLP